MREPRSENMALPPTNYPNVMYRALHVAPCAFILRGIRTLKMAYRDVAPDKESNGKTIVLLHRKECGGCYFHNVIESLTGSGYRVVAPDQIGWQKARKPYVPDSNPRVRWVLALVGVGELLTHSGSELLWSSAQQGWRWEHSPSLTATWVCP
jgi:hypothetical protein